MPKLTVNLVAWNGAKYIPYLFDSLRKQTFQDFKINILDNGSSDDTIGAIKKELNNLFVQYEFVENNENLGFAGGHNLLFKRVDSDYVLLLNQDIYLMPDCLEKLVDFMNNHALAGSVAPRLMQWDFSFIYNNLSDSFTSRVDSLGVTISRNRRFAEWESGEIWDDSVSLPEDAKSIRVFGVSGALPLYRVSALRDVIFSDGYIFDSLYGSYKEDVDLAFRLATAGYESYTVLQAVAYHNRTSAEAENKGDWAAVENKKNQRTLVKYNSYKNHLMTLYKNEYWQNFILDFPWILWYEIKKFTYFLFFDRAVLSGWKELWQNRRKLADKRKQIKGKIKLDWKEIRGWWA
jgi:GT2 family glycosyltransferase